MKRCYLQFGVSRHDVDKNDFKHFLNSVRRHCIILMKATRRNEDIDRAVHGVCDIRPEWTKRNFVFEILSEHLTERIDGLYGLVTLIERLDKSGGASFD